MLDHITALRTQPKFLIFGNKLGKLKTWKQLKWPNKTSYLYFWTTLIYSEFQPLNIKVLNERVCQKNGEVKGRFYALYLFIYLQPTNQS